MAVSALTSDPDGTVYAAAEPSGAIYRIAPDGKSSELCRLPNERVWVLKRQGDALKLGGDIRNITGATLSCRNVTNGVKRLLALHALLLAKS